MAVQWLGMRKPGDSHDGSHSRMPLVLAQRVSKEKTPGASLHMNPASQALGKADLEDLFSGVVSTHSRILA